jgi:hypothetical protein
LLTRISEAGELGERALYQRVERVPMADMAGQGQSAWADGADFPGNRLAGVELAAGNDHIRSAAGKAQRDLPAQAAAAAGHQRGLSGQVK